MFMPMNFHPCTLPAKVNAGYGPGVTILGMFATSPAPTRVPAGRLATFDDLTVIGFALHFVRATRPSDGEVKLAVASRTTVSPHCAAFNAACRSPPAPTTMVAALAELPRPTRIRIETIAKRKDRLNKR